MNKIKMGKVLALIVCLAMIVAAVPAFAAYPVSDENFSISFHLANAMTAGTNKYSDIQILDGSGNAITGFCYAPDGFFPFHREKAVGGGDITTCADAFSTPQTGFEYDANTVVTVSVSRLANGYKVTYAVTGAKKQNNGGAIADYAVSRDYAGEGVSMPKSILAPNGWEIASYGGSPISSENIMTDWIIDISLGDNAMEPEAPVTLTVNAVDADGNVLTSTDIVGGYVVPATYAYWPGDVNINGKLYVPQEDKEQTLTFSEGNTANVVYVPCDVEFKTVDVPETYNDLENSKSYSIKGENLAGNPSFETADGKFSNVGWNSAQIGKGGIGEAGGDLSYAISKTGYTFIDKIGTENAETASAAYPPQDGEYAFGGRWNDGVDGFCSIVKNVYVGNNKTIYVSYWVKAYECGTGLADVIAVKGNAAAAGVDANADEITTDKNGQWTQVQEIVKTDADTDTIQFNAWYLGSGTFGDGNNGSHPYIMLDNMIVAEAEEATFGGAIDYEIEYKSADGTVVKTEEAKGAVGDKVKVAAGKIGNVRVGKTYYTNDEAEIELKNATTKYTVTAAVVDEITGFEPVKVTTVGSYAPALPATVKTVTKENKVPTEDLAVTWDGAVGTVDDIDIKAAAEVEQLAETYGLVDIAATAGQNNYERAAGKYVKFPGALTEGRFVIEFTLDVNAFADQWIFLDDSSKGASFFSGVDQVQLGVLSKGFTAKNGGDDVVVAPLEIGKTYTVMVDVDIANHTYIATVIDENGVSSSSGSCAFRTNANIDSIVTVNNGAKYYYGDGNFDVTNIQVHHAALKDVPSENTVTAGLNFITAGDKKDTLTISTAVVGETDGKNLVITALDSTKEHTPDTEVYNEALTGKPVVLVPANANVYYDIKVVDIATGYVTAAVTANLYELVAKDITANFGEYSKADNAANLARIDKAVEVLSKGGVVDADDAARKAFISVETADESVTISIADGLYANGFGFKGAIKAGASSNVKTTAPEDLEKLYQKITISGDTVTLANADSVVTFSLDDVEIEFVSTEIGELAADSADAELGLVDEL